MTNARIGKEIWVETPDEVGKLAKLCAPVAERRLNLVGLCAWAEGGKGNVVMLAEDEAKVTETLKQAGFNPTTKEVLLVDCENKPGTLFEVAQKLAQNKIGINACYMTAGGGRALCVFSTADNKKAVSLLG